MIQNYKTFLNHIKIFKNHGKILCYFLITFQLQRISSKNKIFSSKKKKNNQKHSNYNIISKRNVFSNPFKNYVSISRAHKTFEFHQEKDFSRVDIQERCSKMHFLKLEYEPLTAWRIQLLGNTHKQYARIAFYSGKARSLNSIPRPHLARPDHGTRPLSVPVAVCKASRTHTHARII